MKELKSLTALIESFSKLPGIGKRSAEKMAHSILDMDAEDVESFSKSLSEAKSQIHKCPICGMFTEDECCEICTDTKRDSKKMIVVSYPKDVYAFEKLGSYDGKYHVLGGVLSALNGVGLDDLSIAQLLERIKNEGVSEIILATNPTTEGETTALYIAKLLEDLDVNVSRLAYGLPMGGHLEYADALTLSKALEGRKKL